MPNLLCAWYIVSGGLPLVVAVKGCMGLLILAVVNCKVSTAGSSVILTVIISVSIGSETQRSRLVCSRVESSTTAEHLSRPCVQCAPDASDQNLICSSASKVVLRYQVVEV